MGELFSVKGTSYKRYEELLLQRDALKKKAYHYDREFVRVFGEQVLEIFRMKMECIKKKKTIHFCRYYANHGKNVDQKALQEFLKNEMAVYQMQLEDMIADYNNAKKSEPISEAEKLLIKKIYRRIAKQFHPDVNPKVAKDETLMELWQRVLSAYTCNDLKELQEAEILVNMALKQMNKEGVDIYIPNIDERIVQLEEELEAIQKTRPYTYRFILEDEEERENQKIEYEVELSEYEDYSKELDQELEALLQKGVTITWQMN